MKRRFPIFLIRWTAILLPFLSVSFASALPNLTPYQPSGWSDKIVVSNTTGINTDSSLTSTDTLYMDWAIANNGSGATAAGFYIKLYVDGIVVDTSGTIAESNEGDNEYTRTITVGEGGLFQGPAQGTSSGGGAVSTDSFASPGEALTPEEEGFPTAVPIGRIPLMKNPPDLLRPPVPAGANEVDDPGVLLRESPGLPASEAFAPTLINAFQGIPQTTSIPPDPILAAGPNHLLAAVNRDFAIFSKSGTKLKQISATAWFQNILPGIGGGSLSGAFDPQVLYDHHANRWIMVWLATDGSTQSWFLISVSDNSDPTGTWCNFALRGDRNGPTDSGNWADYEGLGVDNQAVYLTSNQFKFVTDDYDYAKIRIIDKAQLYSAACPAITWTDFWDLRDPNYPSTGVSTVRPAVTFGTPGVEYLLNDSRFQTGTHMTLWSLTNPLNTTPTLTALDVPVTASTPPPDADQLGGSGGTSTCPAPCLIDVGGRRIRNVVYRNGSVWTAHSVAGGTNNAFARARYVRIGISGPTVLEDISFGSDNCWLYYPAVTVDANDNLVMVYSESCTITYPGIRYTGRTSGDSGLRASAELKAGETSYLKTSTGDSNRWGDYSGIAVDPADPTRIWMLGEYAASPANTWGTYIGQVTFEAVDPGTIAGLISTPNPAQVGQSVTFTVSGTGTCGGLSLTFGDGTSTSLSGPFPITTSHAYTSAGIFTATATGTTSCTDSASVSATVIFTSPPTALVALNGSVLRTGQTITYQATLTPGSTPTPMDIYLGALLPDGVTFLSLIQTAPGVIAIAVGASPTPFLSNVALTSNLVVPFAYTFTGFEPVGTYVTYAGTAITGGDPLQSANQLSLGVQSFQFMP